jgi:hypothetical protein
MERTNQYMLQHLALGVAVATVHIRVVGNPPDPRKFQEMLNTFNRVCSAMAEFIPIYSEQADRSTPVPLPKEEVIHGRFTRGGRSFTTKDGRTYVGLTVVRSDMELAIAYLRRRRELAAQASEPKKT